MTHFLPWLPSHACASGGSADAFAQSTQRLERLKFGPDQQLQAEAFLDAIGVFAPAYESMGLLFAVASKEVTNNVAKLRRNIAAREAARTDERQSKALTLQQLVEEEVAAGKQAHKDGSFEAHCSRQRLAQASSQQVLSILCSDGCR